MSAPTTAGPTATGYLLSAQMPAPAPRHALSLGLAATVTSGALAALRFGYYSAALDATAAYSNVFQADTLADASDAWAAHGIPSLLLTFDAFFASAPNRMVLAPDWRARWAALAASAAPFVANGTLLGFNLGDELVWNCLAPANLTVVADAVRASFPRGSAIVW